MRVLPAARAGRLLAVQSQDTPAIIFFISSLIGTPEMKNDSGSLTTESVTIRQIKAARALLNWSQEALSEHSGVSIATVRRLEAADGALGGRASTGEKLCRALQAAGIDFVHYDDKGIGVMLRQPRM
ncbi:helix-turn-helix transcriptional regulator [Aurantimonas sp. E1-2-R+4]|uniref:helix-turn-helix domain-containing protein n=1 Tax=Aurantimonas sp. E1-2-R+4 TaxID=3113714 RepID=UPI002F940B05